MHFPLVDNEQNRRHVAELLRDPSKALITASELKRIYEEQYLLYLKTFKTDQFGAMRIAAECQHLLDMVNVLEGKHGLAQTGSIAHELFALAAKGKLTELTLVALGMIPVPEESAAAV